MRKKIPPIFNFMLHNSVKNFCWLKPHILCFRILCILWVLPGRVAQSVGHLTRKSGVLGSIPGLATYFRFSFRFFKKGSCQLLQKYVHEVLVNRLGGLSLPRKSVVRLTDRPDMTLDVYRGRKTTMQQILWVLAEHKQFPNWNYIECISFRSFRFIIMSWFSFLQHISETAFIHSQHLYYPNLLRAHERSHLKWQNKKRQKLRNLLILNLDAWQTCHASYAR